MKVRELLKGLYIFGVREVFGYYRPVPDVHDDQAEREQELERIARLHETLRSLEHRIELRRAK